MPALVITRGLPGSGKTTYAEKWVAEDPQRRFRVNRDDLRAMGHGRRIGVRWQEDAVTTAQNAQVLALLRAGLSVIVDDTNLPDASVEQWRRLAKQAGANLVAVDLRDVPVKTCIARDAARGAGGGRLVGAEVIRRIAEEGRCRVLDAAGVGGAVADAAVPDVRPSDPGHRPRTAQAPSTHGAGRPNLIAHRRYRGFSGGGSTPHR
ncbi:putative kinase [Micromonospora olivasterospora]|uniref:Putative kinase n=2 Tax=Micromonospora olivasterospora TaxID=1880 RepID=A0A562IAF9_MICOL|nr:putative kinase [Micromonospora olivasterospora]